MTSLFYKQHNAKLIHDDVLLTGLLDPGSIDLIVTAPPLYLDISYIAQGETDWMYFNFQWMHRALNWLKDGGRMCLNIPIDLDGQTIAADFTELAKQVGFQYEATAVWQTFISLELILFLSKPAPSRNGMGGSHLLTPMPQLWHGWTWGGSRHGHPSPFPISLPRRCIKLLSKPGDVVLDPFSGIGTTVLAAIENKRAGIGIEIETKYHTTAKQQITNFYR